MADSTFDFYFQKADLDRDGKISGVEAIHFFKAANLPQPILAKIWHAADQGQTGFLSRAEFYNALKLVTVAQSGRELTPEIIKAALVGPASQKIPPPKIDAAAPQAAPSQPAQHASFTAQASPLPVQQTPRTSFTGQSPLQPAPVPAPVQQQVSRASYNNGQAFQPAAGFTSQQNPRGSFSNPLPTYQGAPRPVQRPATGGFGATDSWPPARPSTPSVQGQLFTSAPTRPVTSTAFPAPMTPTPAARAGSGVVATAASTGSDSPFGDDAFSVSATNLRPVAPQNVPTPSPVTPQFRPSTPQPAPAASRSFAPSPSGPRPSPPVIAGAAWPKMTTPDVQRYSRVFFQVDTDKDGKITGVQARDLFSSWGLPREVLKQVWDLSDQDGDSMLSFREFCTALYMMERFKEGRPLPPVLPAGFHFDDTTPQSVAAARIAEAQAAIAQHNAGYNLPSWQQNPRMLAPGSMGMPGPGSMGMPPGRAPMPGSHPSNYPSKPKVSQNREEAPPQDENKVLDSKEKLEFYRTKMQELVLFKRKCDNKLAEVTDRATSEKREEETMSKKYEERYKQAMEANARLVSEEAAARELQIRRAELQHAITEVERGGNVNALLQTRADRINNDLDELEQALAQRGQLLGLHVEGTTPIELPFGWQPGLQVNAAQWDENWDKFDDEGFTVVQDIMNQPADAEKSSVPGWDESTMFADGFDFASEAESNVHEHLDEPVAADSPRAASETSSLKSGPYSPKQELWSPKSSPGKSPLSFKEYQRSSEDFLEADSFVTRPSFASSDGFDHGPSFDSGDHPDEQAWASVFTDSNDDVRASWGLQNDSTSQGFDSLDFGSLKISTTSSATRNDANGWMDNSADLFGSSSVPSTPLFTDSPSRINSSSNNNAGSSAYFDNSNNNNSGSSAFFDDSSRLNSFASTQDETDPFAGTGPFGGGTRSSNEWSTF